MPPHEATRYPHYVRDTAYSTIDSATGDLVGMLSMREWEWLQYDGMLRLAITPPSPVEYVGETPTEGEGAVARWLALHDRSVEMRAALRAGDVVGEKNTRRALRSVLLYEHQMTATTRRQARAALWLCTHAGPLPPFSVRVRWGDCYCARCRPPVVETPVLGETFVLQSA